MEEHISYAMRNTEAVQSYIYFNNPFELKSWTFNAVEGVVFMGAILAFLHAIREYKKRGNKAPFFTWIACLLYGIFLEIIVYNFVDNFWHGEFSVMFYHNRFPLYIVLIYPSLIYHVFMTIERFKIHLLPYGRFIEAVIIGFASQMPYLLYDNIGPQMHWWIWDPDHVTLAPFWEAVPATSYHWIFGFTICFAWLCRVCIWDNAIKWRDSNTKLLGAAVFVAVFTSVLGSIGFTPFNYLGYGFKAFDWDQPYGYKMYDWATFLLVAYLFGSAYLYFLTPKVHPKKPDLQLMIFPVLWCSLYIILYAHSFSQLYTVQADGITTYGTPIGNWIIVLVGMHMSLSILAKSHLQGDQLSLYQFKEVFRDIKESIVMIFRVLKSYLIPGSGPAVSNKVQAQKKSMSKVSGSPNTSFIKKIIDDHRYGGATGVEPDSFRHNRGAAFQNVLSEGKPRFKHPRSQEEYSFREQYCEYDAVPPNRESNDVTRNWRELYAVEGENQPATSDLPEVTKKFRKMTPGFGDGCDPDTAFDSRKFAEHDNE